LERGSGTAGGKAMKARIMLDNAPFGPDDLEIARQAFDGAWEAIAARYAANAVDRGNDWQSSSCPSFPIPKTRQR
jgi:hypothetical protein